MPKDLDESQKLILEVDSKFYSKRAVMEVAYKFMDKYFVRVEQPSDHAWRLYFSKKEPKDELPNGLADAFQNELLDRQLRIELEQSFGEIREMIVKQAFWPFEPNDSK